MTEPLTSEERYAIREACLNGMERSAAGRLCAKLIEQLSDLSLSETDAAREGGYTAGEYASYALQSFEMSDTERTLLQQFVAEETL